MGKASRKKRERRYAKTPTEVSSRGSFREQADVTPEKSVSGARPNESTTPPILSEASKLRSANWGGRRVNQIGRPRLYDNDEERRAAAAARRKVARAAAKNPPPKPRDRPPKKEPGSSWGGARSGAGRPLIYKTKEERRARNSELSQQSSAQRGTPREAARFVEGVPAFSRLAEILG